MNPSNRTSKPAKHGAVWNAAFSTIQVFEFSELQSIYLKGISRPHTG
jgi:hypothetical protein